MYGAKSFTSGAYFEHASGFTENASGFFLSLLLLVRSQAVASAGRVLLSKRSTGSTGWNILSSTTNASLTAAVSTTTSTYAAPTVAIAAGDVGKMLVYTVVYDAAASRFRSYAKAVEVGTATTTAGTFAPFAGSLQVGRRNGDVVPADAGIEIYGFTVGNGVPTLLDVQAHHAACKAAGDIAAIAGLSLVTVSVTKDVAANGVAFPAALKDRTGSSDFTRVGSPGLATEAAPVWAY